MGMRKLLFLLLGSVVGWGCCRVPYRSIEFGSEGGFTGKRTAYVIRNNGRLIAVDRSDSFQLSKSEMRKVAHRTRKILKKFGEGYHHPANMTHFIHITTPQRKVSFRWGDAQPPDAEVVDFNEMLWEIARRHLKSSATQK